MVFKWYTPRLKSIQQNVKVLRRLEVHLMAGGQTDWLIHTLDKFSYLRLDEIFSHSAKLNIASIRSNRNESSCFFSWCIVRSPRVLVCSIRHTPWYRTEENTVHSSFDCQACGLFYLHENYETISKRFIIDRTLNNPDQVFFLGQNENRRSVYRGTIKKLKLHSAWFMKN